MPPWTQKPFWKQHGAPSKVKSGFDPTISENIFQAEKHLCDVSCSMPYWSSEDKYLLALNSSLEENICIRYDRTLWCSLLPSENHCKVDSAKKAAPPWDTIACRKHVAYMCVSLCVSDRCVTDCMMLVDQDVYTCVFVSASEHERICVFMRQSALCVKQGLAWRSKSLHNSLVSQPASDRAYCREAPLTTGDVELFDSHYFN